MLTEIYIEALLVDEKAAEQVWETWGAGEIDDQVACIAWMMIAGTGLTGTDYEPRTTALARAAA